MIALYVLASVTSVVLSLVGLIPAALIFAGIGLALVFGAELRAGLRKLRRPAKRAVLDAP